jgi:NFU1 iron-sulfur cluster scaffold homolog, mitochondrial
MRREEREGTTVAEQEPLQIDIEGTPNPNSAKFVLNRTVVDQTRSYFNIGMVTEDDKVAGVAKQLFAISGVRTLMFLNDFITVSKEANADWNMIAEKTQEILEAEHR